jgi:hypothetical protein
METDLDRLTGPGYAEALSRRGALADIALAARNGERAGEGLGPFASVAEYAADLSRRCVCLTLLAGSGSRWAKSLAAAQARGEYPGFDPARPRGLFPVRDFLRGRAGSSAAGGRMAIAAYSLDAVRGLGRHLVVVRGWEAEIDAEVLAPVGIGPAARDFFTQEAPLGKPLGHGDAAWQCRRLWAGADYVVTNFGGDANSRRTVLSSLLALDALRAAGAGVDLLMPAASLPSPAYPIRLDSGGLPRAFGHAKLQGSAGTAGPAGTTGPAAAAGLGYTNVGLRVYSAPALFEAVEGFRQRNWTEGLGYEIPGNDPAGHEFALDNVDALMAQEGRARILAMARSEELTPAKSLEDLPAFERAIESVVGEDAELR